jgi:uridine kinase
MLPLLGIDTWRDESISNLAVKILKIMSKPLLLIDGDGGSGKTTLAKRLVEILKANLVSTDDVCWCANPIYWDDEMITGIVLPWLDGKNITYKPSGWVKENRLGFIKVDAKKGLIVEGMGACRKTLRKFATYSIWVDTEPDIARTRVIHRDIAAGENGGTHKSVTEFTDWWDSLVHPFLLEEEPWKYVDIIVSGSQSDLLSNILRIHIPDNPV